MSVDEVYKTVLYILNKEQRGFLTPEEFNKVAAQVQLELFEKYFEDLTQQLRLPDMTDSEYANRVKTIEENSITFYDQINPSFEPPKYNNPLNWSTTNYACVPARLLMFRSNFIHGTSRQEGEGEKK